MEGTITQLGLENYLINDKLPKKSFFQHSYENYFNFGKDVRNLQFNNGVNFGRDSTIKISENARYGDLISNMVICLELPDLTNLTTTTNETIGYCNSIGYAIIKEVQLKIGGNIIDTQTGEWLYTWSQLVLSEGKRAVFNDNIKKFNTNSPDNFKGGKVFIPLQFWFCQLIEKSSSNIPLVFPLIAMKNSEIELIVRLKKIEDILISVDNSKLSNEKMSKLNILNNSILIDYIILMPEERIKYLNAKNQIYLITQVQEHRFMYSSGVSNINVNLRNFRYPIIEILWTLRDLTRVENNEYFNFTDNDINNNNRSSFYSTAKLTFDGRDRIPEIDSNYFTNIEPGKIHKSVPFRQQINCFSFSIKPEKFEQPNGSCNFSGLHEPKLILKMRKDITIPDIELIVYGFNYNVLQINDKGNVWLLHNLSKSTPDELPDLTKGRYLDTCNLTNNEAKKAEELINEINKLNLFTDPRKIESGLLNIISKAKRQEIINGRSRPDCISENEIEFLDGYVQPYLNSLIEEVKRINEIIHTNRKRDGKDIKFTDNSKKYADVGGIIIDMDNIELFLENLLSQNNNF